MGPVMDEDEYGDRCELCIASGSDHAALSRAWWLSICPRHWIMFQVAREARLMERRIAVLPPQSRYVH